MRWSENKTSFRDDQLKGRSAGCWAFPVSWVVVSHKSLRIPRAVATAIVRRLRLRGIRVLVAQPGEENCHTAIWGFDGKVQTYGGLNGFNGSTGVLEQVAGSGYVEMLWVTCGLGGIGGLSVTADDIAGDFLQLISSSPWEWRAWGG